ncbi:hopanoid biosynthesis associated protein HpnK [Hydrogenispora ethanolica]|uniref:Hopanoid biosynthesis associated protein HpnK n=1 Tax=Hydrogenispora ethanolica TaxID=1082276 RepID=A0A4R1RQ15_HYDET|nr:ChbG/HpnK family deacetylase [Hydrogenispora ethanolica]TCL68468.1 hopanoid biosynthesis associated protein HpnK [Hydrogenispora ethanolica]
MKRLIVNADDFGLHESINRAIFRAHREGCVTSATLVAGGAAFDQAVNLARQCPGLGVGVHLTLVGLRPVARGNVRSLVTEDGSFWPDYLAFSRQYLMGRIEPEQVETELRCQLQKVMGSGIPITHLDSHQHLHVLPGFPRIIGKLASEFGIERIRIPAEPAGFVRAGSWSWGRLLGRTLLTACSVEAGRHYRRLRLRHPDHFFGMLSGGRMNDQNLQAILTALPEGTTELMVHPGLDNATLDTAYHWGYQWQAELEALCSPAIAGWLRKMNVTLINYREL